MRTAIITANIGGFDEVFAPAKQKEAYDFIYLTENSLPFPLAQFDNRLKGKYLKTQPHTFLDHDLFIWVDSCVEIIDGTFINFILEKLKSYEFVSSLHPDRDNVYDEIDHIITSMKKGNKYLLDRYAKQPFAQEKEFYRNEEMPDDFPLYQGWFYATTNTPRMNKIFNQWWELILRYSNFDQSQLAYVLWKNKVDVFAMETDTYLTRHHHKGYSVQKYSLTEKVKSLLV
jgi:hypothetical protein